jgi:hypothetical protein
MQAIIFSFASDENGSMLFGKSFSSSKMKTGSPKKNKQNSDIFPTEIIVTKTSILLPRVCDK